MNWSTSSSPNIPVPVPKSRNMSRSLSRNASSAMRTPAARVKRWTRSTEIPISVAISAADSTRPGRISMSVSAACREPCSSAATICGIETPLASRCSSSASRSGSIGGVRVVEPGRLVPRHVHRRGTLPLGRRSLRGTPWPTGSRACRSASGGSRRRRAAAAAPCSRRRTCGSARRAPRRRRLALAELHDRGDPLAPALVGHADDDRVEHGGVGLERLLDLLGVDLLAAGVDADRAAAEQRDRAVGLDAWRSRRGST